MDIVAEKLYAGSRGRPAENFALLDKIVQFSAYIIYSLSIFSLQVAEKPRAGDAPSLVVHLSQMKHLLTYLLWSPYVIEQTIIFLPCGYYLSIFFISSPNLSGRRLDVYHTSTHGVALVRI